MMLDHYQQTKNMLVSYSPKKARLLLTAGVATTWRRAGAVAVLVPADPGVPEVAVVSDLFAAGFRRASHITDVRESPIWVEAGAVEGLAPGADAVAGARVRCGGQRGAARISRGRKPSMRP
jgi:hypothetical protein